MDVLRTVAIDARDIPADVKIRHVDVPVIDEKTQEVIRVDQTTPESETCYRVEVGASTPWVNGDHHLEETPPPEDDRVVGTFTKINPKTGDAKYGPAPLRQSQYDAWRAAGAI